VAHGAPDFSYEMLNQHIRNIASSLAFLCISKKYLKDKLKFGPFLRSLGGRRKGPLPGGPSHQRDTTLEELGF